MVATVSVPTMPAYTACLIKSGAQLASVVTVLDGVQRGRIFYPASRYAGHANRLAILLLLLWLIMSSLTRATSYCSGIGQTGSHSASRAMTVRPQWKIKALGFPDQKIGG